jgi:hypothetical protein
MTTPTSRDDRIGVSASVHACIVHELVNELADGPQKPGEGFYELFKRPGVKILPTRHSESQDNFKLFENGWINLGLILYKLVKQIFFRESSIKACNLILMLIL